MIDLQLDICPVAWSILHLVKDQSRFDQHVNITTSAWYNGREKGICLTVFNHKKVKSSIITFGKVKNTDSIFIDSWEINGGLLNPPTVSDFNDEAYSNRKYLNYDKIYEAAQLVIESISKVINDL